VTRLTYEEARSVVKDGDIVFIHGQWNDPIQAVVMFFTASLFSHVCIAFWATTPQGKMLMCVEAQGKTRRRIFPLSFYSDNEMTVIVAPKPWKTVESFALSKVGKAEYGMLEAMYVGAREFVLRHTGYKLPVRYNNKEYCSTFVASVYGLDVESGSPQTLYEHLVPLYSVREVQSA
jgi:Permuted papain-like amidase enzyme, YaeF/YiiX, C92 family